MPTKLEESFQKAVLKQIALAEKHNVPADAKFIANIQKFGAVESIRRYLSRGQALPGFTALCKAGQPAASIEAAVVDAKFAALFTDDEVNACFDALVEAGLYL